ncbi:methyl-accepting chemotaxis protein [Paenibacillus sp. GCM10012307]|uniref:MCP four helix bundle domain-containing protein n=1 Tax=Paenibacillus roseus TaxID=2798579 RepID=A0A934J2D6_9BACL|nr:methyl-accepting chemotaxis protein [Paenibacillus roseus]MBJ6360304.1 MCP four helix bundle domain-containing protein [Paenibacillus roseus]
MQWIANMKLAKKLTFSFILIALMAGAVGLIGIINLKKVDEQYSDLYVNFGVSTGDLGKAGIAFHSNRSNMRSIVLSDDFSRQQSILEDIKVKDKEVADMLNKYEQSIVTEEMRNSFDELKQAIAVYNKNRDHIVDLGMAGRKEEANQEIVKASGLSDQATTLLDRMFEDKRTTGLRLSEEYSASANQTVITMIIIVIVAVAAAIGLGLFISRIVSRPVSSLVGAAHQMADGNLDVNVDVTSKDEIGVLAHAFRKMAENMNEVLGNIQAASEQVASGARQVSESGMILSQGAAEQASSVEQLTVSLDEISSQTKLNADTARQANELAENAKETALAGNRQMQEMLKAMDDINTASENISKIIKVIDEIAFQTNILALNAAVEAARAGQHGKGFAVVAEEVRNLAARSAGAAKETTDMIEGSIRKVKDGMQIAVETAGALNKIVEGVSRAANLVGNISEASNEQAAGISQINQGILQVSQVVQTNSATSEESAAASEELSGQAALLQEQVGRFRLKRSVRGSYRELDDLNPEVLRMLENMSARRSAPAEDSYEETLHRTSASAQIPVSDKEFGKY